MNFKNILKVFATINIILSLFFLLDIGVAIIYDEAYYKFLDFLIIFIALNALIFATLYKHKVNLKIKGSIVTVNLIWLILGSVGAVPLILYSHIDFASAFFEAISGFTTTGATVYQDIESLPHMLLFHRSLMHWLGGMGIVVLSVGLLSIINPNGGLSLFKAEATGVSIDKIRPKIKDTAKTLWLVYIILTLIDTILLKLFGMGWFDAINHAFSTISTGGFSTKNSSLGFWGENLAIVWITTIFMILSGINFIAHIKLFNDDFNGYKTSEVKWYFIIFFTLSILLTYYYYLNVGNNLIKASSHSFFTIASILTTTGFATTNWATWGSGAIVLVFIAMFIGGNAGSTAGGVKVIRYVIIFKTIFSELKRAIKPNSIISVFVDGSKVSEKVILSVFVFFFLFLLTNVAIFLYLLFNGHNTLTSLSAAFAVVGNIGPGFGNIDPASNFAFFSPTEKIVLSIAMIIGRLECFTLFVLFSPSFWKRF